MEMGAGFYVNREIVRSSFRELGDKGVGVGDHEMDVERQRGNFSKGRHDRRTDGQIRNEMSVHDIDVQKIGPSSFHGCYLLGQSGKVSS
jgi:hypothetical protein